jgi:hypothetical protein
MLCTPHARSPRTVPLRQPTDESHYNHEEITVRSGLQRLEWI